MKITKKNCKKALFFSRLESGASVPSRHDLQQHPGVHGPGFCGGAVGGGRGGGRTLQGGGVRRHGAAVQRRRHRHRVFPARGWRLV